MCEIYFISEKKLKICKHFYENIIVFQNNDTVTNLDLEDDGIEAEGAKAIAEMLEINTNIVDVVSGCCYSSILHQSVLCCGDFNLRWYGTVDTSML